MRAAFVCADLGVPVFGAKGCSVHVQELLRALVARGVAIELFAARLGGTRPSGLEPVIVHPLPKVGGGEAAARELALCDLDQVIGARLRAAGPFDFVYERHALFAAAAMEYAREARVPGLLEVNAPLVEEQERHRTLVHRGLAEAARARAFAAARVLLPVSAELGAWIERDFAVDAAICVAPNGVDVARFAAATARRTGDSFTLGFVGGLRPWHGLADLAAIFARVRRDVPEAQLLVVGDGPGREALVADLEARGVAHAARLVGAVAPDAVPAFVAAMDVALAPYPLLGDFYFSPLKVFEYMGAGRAVVASRIGQIASLVRDGETGRLYEPGDIEGAARAVVELARDGALRMRLGAAAQALALEQYTWDAVAGRILALVLPRPRTTAVA